MFDVNREMKMFCGHYNSSWRPLLFHIVDCFKRNTWFKKIVEVVHVTVVIFENRPFHECWQLAIATSLFTYFSRPIRRALRSLLTSVFVQQQFIVFSDGDGLDRFEKSTVVSTSCNFSRNNKKNNKYPITNEIADILYMYILSLWIINSGLYYGEK